MRKVLEIALNDLRIQFKDRSIWIGLVVVPIAMTFAIGFANSQGGPSRLRVDVIDADGSALSNEFLNGLRAANNSLVLCPFDNDEADFCALGDNATLDEARAVARLTDNTSLALIEIPAGFEASLQAGQPASIVYRSNENAAAPGYILQAVQAVVQKMGGALVAAKVGADSAEGVLPFADDAERAAYRQAIYERAAALWAQDPIKVDFRQSVQQDNPANSGAQRGFGQSIPGMGSMFVMFMVFTALYVLIRERNAWTLQRLVMMPLSRSQILSGKILTWFTMGMIQYLVIFAVGLLVRLHFGNDLIGVLVVMVAFTLCMTALAFAVSTLVKNEMQANSVQLLLALTLAPLGGAWWPLNIVPEFMRTVGHVSPVAWAMDAFNRLLFAQGTLGDVLPQLGVLLALAAALFAFAIWRFRYE